MKNIKRIRLVLLLFILVLATISIFWKEAVLTYFGVELRQLVGFMLVLVAAKTYVEFFGRLPIGFGIGRELEYSERNKDFRFFALFFAAGIGGYGLFLMLK